MITLNPCKKCGNITNILIDSTDVFCNTLDCRNQVEYDGTLQNAIAAWNKANPDVGALQRAALKSLMQRYGVNGKLSDVGMPDYDRFLLQLLVDQGVLSLCNALN